MPRIIPDDIDAYGDSELPAAPPDTARDDAIRIFYSALRMWRSCPDKACRRARRCVGRLDRCQARFGALPDELRGEVQRMVREAARMAAAREAGTARRIGDCAPPSPRRPRHDRRAPPVGRPDTATRPPR